MSEGFRAEFDTCAIDARSAYPSAVIAQRYPALPWVIEDRLMCFVDGSLPVRMLYFDLDCDLSLQTLTSSAHSDDSIALRASRSLTVDADGSDQSNREVEIHSPGRNSPRMITMPAAGA